MQKCCCESSHVCTESNGVPVGTVIFSHILQPGYVKANGQKLNRCVYQKLYKFASDNNLMVSEEEWANGMQGMYGVGDGGVTFRLPDLRGQFLRGLDEGSGIDEERKLGSRQKASVSVFDPNKEGAVVLGLYNIADEDIEGFREKVSFDKIDPKNYEGVYASRYVSNETSEGEFDKIAGGVRPTNVALIPQIKY